MSYQGAHSGAEVDDAVGAGKGTGNGVMVKSGTGAGVRRTITGSTRVDVTNGDGVSGNPTLDLTQAVIDSLARADVSVMHVDTIADLQALPTSGLVDGQGIKITTTGRAGDFVVRVGDFSTDVANDPQNGVWMPFDADPTGASIVAMRKYSLWSGVEPEWFGAVVDGVTDAASAIQATDDYAASSGVPVRWPSGTMRIVSGISKDPRTTWSGAGGNLSSGGAGSKLLSDFNGVAVSVTGDSVSRRGNIEKIRFENSDRAAHTASTGLRFQSDVRDHIVSNCFIANYNDNILVDNCKAIYLDTVYSFGAITDGVRIQSGSTDCWIINTQSDGDRYGIHLDGTVAALASMQVINSRPQVSGVANLFADGVSHLQWRGGFSDTAINGAGTGGKGGVIRNCLNWTVSGVQFYSNGDGVPHLEIGADTGGACTDGIVKGNHFKKSPGNTGTISGIKFADIAGTCRRITVSSNDLFDLDQSIEFSNITGLFDTIGIKGGNILNPSAAVVNPNLIGSDLHYSDNIGQETYKAFSSPASDIVLDSITSGIIRMFGAIDSNINIDLPTKGNYAGKTIKIIRQDGGTGTVSVRYNGTTTAHQLTAGSQWVEVVSIGSGTTWVESASDNLSR